MRLIIPVILNILLTITFYSLKKKGKFDKFSNIKLQILIGLCFGVLSAFSSEFGEEFMGVVVNVRDAAPISAGLIFGSLAGIIAGLMGGTYRALSVLWGASTYTVVACTISTILAGFFVAAIRRFMFDNKRPTITYAIGFTVLIEVFHMLMIFITNFNDANNAFMFVRECTLSMIVANSIAVGLSVFIVSLIAKEFKIGRPSKEKGIAHKFQIWLLFLILIGFFATSIFTFNLQSEMNNKNIEDIFTVAVTDAATDIKEKSAENLLSIITDVKKKYEVYDFNIHDLLHTEDYDIIEINIFGEDGIILESTDPKNKGFDMRSNPQSNEFMLLFDEDANIDTFVQDYRLNGNSLYRKYAGIKLSDGNVIQVGYDSEQFHSKLDSFVIEVTKNRHVGKSGFIAICDEDFNIVSNNENYKGKHITSIGIKVNKEMLSKKTSTQVYRTNIVNNDTDFNEEYMYVYTFIEGYCIIAAISLEEAMLMRDASMYLAVFMQIIIFALLFILIFYLIKKIIVNNLHKINEDLSKITGGNLNVLVDVRASEEFSTLSDDINSTVSTLKRYIAEAAQRIDKELEYAKQIQLSALPINFPNNNDYNIYASMIAAKEVGGDFYDYFKIDENNIAFLVADVSGKGIPSAMFMMTAKTIIKDLAESKLEVDEILNRANDKLCENNESAMFVTAWVGILNIESGVLSYANAGHNPPLLLNENGSFEYLKSKAGFILGGMEGIKYKKFDIKLLKGSKLFLYTDGVSEATNTNEELFGEERLIEFMNKNKELSATDLLPKLKEEIDNFVGEAPQFDDITMLMLNYTRANKSKISRIFKALDEELNNVLSLVESELESYNCSMKNINAISVAVEEMFVNIAHYAYKKEIGDCTITLEFDENIRELTIVLEDNGIPFNPLTKNDPDVTLSAEERSIGGLGIYIVKKTMDKITYKYENDTNILTMKKFI